MEYRAAGLSLLLAFVTLGPACGGREPTPKQTPPAAAPADAAAPGSAAAPPGAPPAAAPGLPTDEELMAYLTWMRDWNQLTASNVAEYNATVDRVAANYSLAETDKVAHDPEIVAASARTAEANKAHFDQKPSGRKIDGTQATLEGLGLTIAQTDYSGIRNEEALARARRMYGDNLVEWVLEREATIASTLCP
jgi:hypothetical protein